MDELLGKGFPSISKACLAFGASNLHLPVCTFFPFSPILFTLLHTFKSRRSLLIYEETTSAVGRKDAGSLGRDPVSIKERASKTTSHVTYPSLFPLHDKLMDNSKGRIEIGKQRTFCLLGTYLIHDKVCSATLLWIPASQSSISASNSRKHLSQLNKGRDMKPNTIMYQCKVFFFQSWYVLKHSMEWGG